AWALSALDAEVVFVWHSETELPDLDAVVLPGGFSYGDYLRCGAIARFAPAMEAVVAFAADGGLVLGICHGFQILCEAGLLHGVAGVVNELGNVMGLMPHPEHAVDSLLGSADGTLILSSLVESARDQTLATV